MIGRDGKQQFVLRVEQEYVSGFAIVNLTIEQDHTFAVGSEGVLVHNSCAQPVKVEQHHSDPLFMGGARNQKKTSIAQDVHRGKGDSLHNNLNDFLRKKTDDAGNHMRPQRGNKADDIQRNFSREERLDAMAEFYKNNQDRYPDVADDFFGQHPSLE